MNKSVTNCAQHDKGQKHSQTGWKRHTANKQTVQVIGWQINGACSVRMLGLKNGNGHRLISVLDDQLNQQKWIWVSVSFTHAAQHNKCKKVCLLHWNNISVAPCAVVTVLVVVHLQCTCNEASFVLKRLKTMPGSCSKKRKRLTVSFSMPHYLELLRVGYSAQTEGKSTLKND